MFGLFSKPKEPKEPRVNNYPDIPDCYDITHFPSDGRYFPMLNGEYLWSGYRDSGRMETTSTPYQAFPCKTIEECIVVIRHHMEWKKPVTVSDWRGK